MSLLRDVSEVEMKILDKLSNSSTQDMVDNINTRARYCTMIVDKCEDPVHVQDPTPALLVWEDQPQSGQLLYHVWQAMQHPCLHIRY